MQAREVRAWPQLILVVDDDQDAREAVVVTLNEEGYYQCECVASGADALARVARALEQGRPCSAVLLDVWMPGLSGIEVLARLREVDPCLHACMFTAANGGTAIESIRVGEGAVAGYVSKGAPGMSAHLRAGLAAATKRTEEARERLRLLDGLTRLAEALGRYADGRYRSTLALTRADRDAHR